MVLLLKQTQFLVTKLRKTEAVWRHGLVAFLWVALLGSSGPISAQAGDILRGGAANAGSKRNAEARAAAGAEAAALAKQNAVDRLARTSQALAAVRAMQKAARAGGAINNLGENPNFPGTLLPDVPNGLGTGGLDINGSPIGANSPTQSSSGEKFNVNVKQTAQQAILYWHTFNIGSKTTLTFDQSAGGADVGKWIAFNKITDPTGAPSQILGSIKAAGQVYVINQNGIIFGGRSQVNAHALVASSLPINDNLVSAGLLNNPDAQFLFSALALPAGSKGTPAFNPEAPPIILNGKRGDVTVQAGAIINVPTSAEKTGGRVVLVGPNVTNEGTILTPDGQTILAAGLQVGFDSHASSDASLRGLDVYVGKVTDGITIGGTVTNAGLIEAMRGNISIAGKDVEQMGFLNSSTSVSLNGRIDLSANYDAISNVAYQASNTSLGLPFLFTKTGSVVMGANSVMQIIPETWSNEKAVGTQLALGSRINVQGLAIHMASNAILLAPNASVSFKAGEWRFEPSATQPRSKFAYTKGQIYIDGGALIDVAGTTDVSAPISQNILTLELRGGELADSPLQRDGQVRGSEIVIDIRKTGSYNGFEWVGTPLGNATGFVGLIDRTVAQLTTAGGTVNLNAGGSVVLQEGSLIDVSGGWIRYTSGMVETTRLTAQGQIINIDKATPDRLYDGIFTSKFFKTSSKWGITEVFGHPLAPTGKHFEESYIHGANAGSIAIGAPSMALDGDMAGHTIVGPRQLRDSANSSALPGLATLSLSFQAQDPSFVGTDPPFFAPTPPTVTFNWGTLLSKVGAFSLDANGQPFELDDERKSKVVLSPDLLTEDGFGNLNIDNRDGNVNVPAGVNLATYAGGSINIKGANIDIQGGVFAPGGTLSFEVHNVSQAVFNALNGDLAAVTPAADPLRGLFTLGAMAKLSVAGLIVDDRPTAPEGVILPMKKHGGSINIVSYSADLADGSVIDASGGLTMSARGTKTYGNGGSILIATGQDPILKSVLGGQLNLGSMLLGYSGATAGSLSIQSSFIRISDGGSNTVNNGIFSVSPDFFNQGGFGSFTLIGLGGSSGVAGEFLPAVWIAPGTVIAPTAQSLLGIPHGPGGSGILMTTVKKPEGLRTPVSLSFKAPGVRDQFGNKLLLARGDIVFGNDALIKTDAGATVSFSGQTVDILGSIYAPAGWIEVKGSDSFPAYDQGNPATTALTTVHIGPNAFLSTAGKTLLLPDSYGRRTGSVLPGGLITVSGNILAESGAILDVSGTSGVLDLSPAVAGLLTSPEIPVNSGVSSQLFSIRTVATTVDSDAGAIVLDGGEQMFVDATLLGKAGGHSALGGSLLVSSGKFYLPSEIKNSSDINLVVTQSGQSIPSSAFPSGIGLAVRDGNGNVIPGMGYFSVDRFSEGGFDALVLGGNVHFSGPVDIVAAAALKVATGGVLSADSPVTLTAPYVALGQVFESPYQPQQRPFVFTETNATGGLVEYFLDPTFGPGSLTVNARLIDIGNLSLQNIGQATLSAINGDVRGNGTFNIAGDLTLIAGQVYPTTAASFTITAFDYDLNGVPTQGSVTIEGSGDRQLPLSAGGQLNIYGSIINQNGVLRAPNGVINLGWDGSGTGPVNPISGGTVPVTSQLTLGSGSVTSVSMVDPMTGKGILVPYGFILNDSQWIDPKGVDITVSGLPAKRVNLSASSISTESGSVIDISAGGDLYASSWVQGLGGSSDILSSQGSFAVIPGYQANYSPFAPYNTSSAAENLAFGMDGYMNKTLVVGDSIYLSGSDSLPAGLYTLLPARYALLPGAVLVTPKSGDPVGNFELPDGSSLVSGYRYNNLNSGAGTPRVRTKFEVASSSVVRARAEYKDFFANAFLSQRAGELEQPLQRLPRDAGQLVFQATQGMNILGLVKAGSAGGRGSLIDISSPVDIFIGGPGATSGPPGTMFLGSPALSSFSAGSLLIGGTRTVGVDGTTLTVSTKNITVDNAGSSLVAPEILLVAKENLTLADGASVESSGSTSAGEDLLITGDGVLLRVSGDGSAKTARTGTTASLLPTLNVGAGALISGENITLDSTSAMFLDPTAVLDGRSISINSGQIVLALDNAGVLPSGALVLAGQVLQGLQGANSLSLLSYSSIDIYGSGGVGGAELESLALRAGKIRGFNNSGDTVTFTASNILLENTSGKSGPASVPGLTGTLAFQGDTILLGVNQTAVENYANLELTASLGIRGQGTGGLSTQGNLIVTTPVLTGANAAVQSITSLGDMILQSPALAPTEIMKVDGLGSSLKLTGSSILAATDIHLPGGLLELRATTGDVSVAGQLDVSGVSKSFGDLVRYTDGGEVSILSDLGNINVTSSGVISVAAQAAGGSAGTLSVRTPNGTFANSGTFSGSAGTDGQNGSFLLDVGSLPSMAALSASLEAASFTESQTFRVRTGSVLVDGISAAHLFKLSADQGSITVTGAGKIDASGETGGKISLTANGSVVLEAGSELTVAAGKFSAAGKGGSVSLEAGAQRNGIIDGAAVVDIQTGSLIDLSVASEDATSAFYGNFTGTLHLRAPQVAAGNELQMNAINGSIVNASGIVIEGYKLVDLTASGGAITAAVQANVKNNGITFGGGIAGISNRLLANNAGLASTMVVVPGTEIINRTGDLTLGTATSTAATDWNLETYRFGPQNAPGVLTLRAAGDLIFYSTLSDGFRSVASNAASGFSNMWLAPLINANTALPRNVQSWSYRLTAGSDMTAANVLQVQKDSLLAAGKGSVLIGKNMGQALVSSGGNARTSQFIGSSNVAQNNFNVIRTGTGNIEIAAGRDVQLLNQFATVYTAGVRVADFTTIYSPGDFSVPQVDIPAPVPSQGALGGYQQMYGAQYSFSGGNVSLFAQRDIARYTKNGSTLVADSSRQVPENWLYRRGAVDPVTGLYANGSFVSISDPSASTTWWVDYSNFFQGIGALGGGDVTLSAGRDISNVDAVVPTNARTPSGLPDADLLFEQGGGDLTVSAVRNIDAGMYYVERGEGVLSAGGSIVTNRTRSPSKGIITSFSNPEIFDERTWLPTTLFVGKGGFDVTARGNVLLGPTANPFILPQGQNNKYWYKTYFSTYATDSYLNVSSLGGTIDFRLATILPNETSAKPILQVWMQTENVWNINSTGAASHNYPWLRLAETSVTPFDTAAQLLPGNLTAVAFSGGAKISGDMVLSPSSTGNLEIIVAGEISGLQPIGVSSVLLSGQNTVGWYSSKINLSDASPLDIPGVASPFAYRNLLGASEQTPGRLSLSSSSSKVLRFLDIVDNMFAETGTTTSVIQTKQSLHAPGLLHAGDPDPLRLYAAGGNLAGLTVFSAKPAHIFAQKDIRDIAFYFQNLNDSQVSVVAAGRDIVAFDTSTPARSSASKAGNSLTAGQKTLAGDIQISGPGALEVLAGRNLDLGTGPLNSDGTGTGIASVGNARNPYLPFEGADLFIGAGVGPSTGLDGSGLDFDAFKDEFVEGGDGDKYLAELEVSDFQALSIDAQNRVALQVFYLVLRDTGRGFAETGGYERGFEAIDTLFANAGMGGVETQSRDIRTKSGGDINIFVPGGGLQLQQISGSAANEFSVPSGIVTESGGNIGIFTDGDVNIGIARIFTLKGGNQVIWSSSGDIAAGSSSKTVQSAPPTRVIIDPQSADVQTDLAGLATGGGIGVLATVEGVEPGNVDLIAPTGTIDAGDAGIRSSGNITLAAVSVLNAGNIAGGGTVAGAPSSAPASSSAPVSAPSSSAGATASAANEVANQGVNQPPVEEEPSLITAEVLGYGGGSGMDEEEEKEEGESAEG